MTVYRGMRDDGIVEVRTNGKPLPARHDLCPYATHFNWGTADDATSQLALAMLAHALQDDHAAKQAHVDFKLEVLSRLNHDEWIVDRESIVHWFYDWSKTSKVGT
jgi:hypothetical protein